MDFIKQFITQNPCYTAGRTIVPKGIMVHSTATPGVMAKDWFSRWNKSTMEKAVHAFADDKEVCQHLPWNHRAWHCGDAGNNTHIAFEICEPVNWKSDEEYFEKAYKNAVELTAFLCKEYHLPATSVISHKEGHQKGIASNHGDPEHWWRYFGYSMNEFRRDVAKALKGEAITVSPYTQNPLLQSGDTGAQVVRLQGLLNLAKQRLSLSFGKLIPDGIFGAKTLWAVKDFQIARGLVVDGVVGPKTWQALIVRSGDVTGDGALSAQDALKVLRHSVGKEPLSPENLQTADVNGDQKVNAKDATEILKQAVGGE